ncbi:hypothetical protein, partial [Ruminococcus callidus]
IFPKYLGKYARKMRAGRYETGSEEKFASRWRAKSPDALCAVLPLMFVESCRCADEWDCHSPYLVYHKWNWYVQYLFGLNQ